MAKSAAALKPKPLDGLDPLVAVVIGALKHNDEQRDSIEAGVYAIDAVVHIKAQVNVSEDAPAKQVNKIEPWTIITLLLDKLPGVKIEDIVAEADALLEVKKKAVEATAEAAKERAQTAIDLAKEKAQQAVDAIKDSTVQMRKGAVSIRSSEVKIISNKKVKA